MIYVTITAAGASEQTQEIDYKSCDTIEIRMPKPPTWRTRLKRTARAAWSFFVDRVFPPLIGCFLGLSLAAAFWLLILLWWLDA